LRGRNISVPQLNFIQLKKNIMEGVIGFTTAFAGNFAPKAWALCQGQILSIASNTALFSIIGTNYGGNGTTTFGLPDLRGRAVIGAGQGPGLSSYVVGEQGGVENNTMSQTQMPAHTHPLQVTMTPPASTVVSNSSPVNGVYGTGTENLYSGSADVFMKGYQGTLTTGPAGTPTPFPILHPVLGLNYIICLQGVYPARN
jgi:microcystin-dependent protein